MAADNRAWCFKPGGYPSGLHLSSTKPPEDAAPNHLLVRIHAAALNPVDIQLMNLLGSFPISWITSTEKTLCSDFSGTVISAGSGADGFAKGDEIFGLTMAPWKNCGGTLAEVAHLDLASTTVVKRPAEWSHSQAAGLGCVWLTARTCVELCQQYIEPTSSKRVVVLGGSSATGMYTILLCKKRGWKVLSTCSGRNADFVGNSVGADEVHDYTKGGVRQAVQNFNPDAIVDCVGGTECLGIAKRFVTIVGDKTGRTSMGGSFLYLYNPQMVWRW